MKKTFLSVIFILLFASIIVVQIFYDSSRSKEAYHEPFVMKPEVIKAADLGLNNAAADLEWLAAIQYVGGGQSKNYEKMDDYLFLSAALDPKFAYPYAFGVLMLQAFGQIDRVLELGLIGIENNVADWRIPYYMATTYHINLSDTENAAKYFDIAAHTPGAPDNIKKVAATYGTRADIRDKTKQIWEGIYETTNDEVVRQRAQDYIVHFDILDLLEQSAQDYHKIDNKYPASPDDLVKAGILRAVPPDPFGFTYTFDENGKAQIK
jgi:hypothetical protein